ncbi:MAG: carboxypeptidase-like regulatory domain-containing protein [Vicinamibacterales bacterium]
MAGRRLFVGLVMAMAGWMVPSPADALTCFPRSIDDDVTAGGRVFEATIASRTELPLYRALDWFGVRVSQWVPRFELSLEDVQPMLGPAPPTIRTGLQYLQPGSRYVFVARPRRFGAPVVSVCVGWAIEPAHASELKAWIASLSQPPAGGRLFGRVPSALSGGGPDGGVPAGGVRVIARGPVVVETVADARGKFGFRGLPDGRYDVSAESIDRRGRRRVSLPTTEWLFGEHAVALVSLSVSYNLPADDTPQRPIPR